MPKISVIIPVYNVEEYLAECIDSILNQTLQDIEVICVNDGSNDQSSLILDEFAKKDSRIKVFHQKNKGVGYSRNKGIKKAKGQFIAFMDPDDLYPNKNVLEIMYNNATQNYVNICGGGLLHLRKNQIVQTGTVFDTNQLIKYIDYQYDYAFYRFIYNRDFLLKHNIFFPNHRRFQDPPFFVKAMFFAKTFYAIKQPTYLYRKGHRQLQWTCEKQLGLLRGLCDNFIFAKKHNLKDLYKLTSQRFYEHRNVFYTQNCYLKSLLYLLMFYFCFDKYSLVIIKRIIENFLYKKRCIKHLKKQLKLKQLCLWGASLYIEEFLSKYKIKTPNIIGIIDTNPERCGKTFANYKIFSPNQIKDIKPKYILLTIKNNHKQRYVDIQNFLKENNSNIILLPNIFEGEPIYD